MSLDYRDENYVMFCNISSDLYGIFINTYCIGKYACYFYFKSLFFASLIFPHNNMRYVKIFLNCVFNLRARPSASR